MNADNPSSLTGMRLDKWLWCARFFKTRAMAAAAIKSRKIKLNDHIAKPSKIVRIGDQLQICKTPYQFSITLSKLSRQRLSATGAALLYQERQQSIDDRQALSVQLNAEFEDHSKTRGRPSKRDRRNLMKFKRPKMTTSRE